MKNLLLTFLGIMFFLSTSLAQNYIGLAGGGGTPNKIGLRLSLPVNIHLAKSLSFQPELVYVEHNTSHILRKLGQKDYRSSQAAYLAVPLLLKAAVEFEKLNLFVLIGPRFAYGIRLRANYLTDTGFFREKLKFQDVELQRIDLGVLLGVGLKKTINNNRKIFLDCRYYLGLMDIDLDIDRVVFPEGFFVNIGLLIPIDQ
ncbi:MAG: hypothetical protein DHS20C18_03480 [Saprospiraceae bacterium]|nr:MAG: hypothetical protein DHS20C18_03480 [Saprospiraceae bacterium]